MNGHVRVAGCCVIIAVCLAIAAFVADSNAREPAEGVAQKLCCIYLIY